MCTEKRNILGFRPIHHQLVLSYSKKKKFPLFLFTIFMGIKGRRKKIFKYQKKQISQPDVEALSDPLSIPPLKRSNKVDYLPRKRSEINELNDERCIQRYCVPQRLRRCAIQSNSIVFENIKQAVLDSNYHLRELRKVKALISGGKRRMLSAKIPFEQVEYKSDPEKIASTRRFESLRLAKKNQTDVAIKRMHDLDHQNSSDCQERFLQRVLGETHGYPMSFTNPYLGIKSELLAQELQKVYHKPTPIQALCIPLIKQGNHIIGHAPTGSGKTLAYLTPLIDQFLSFCTCSIVLAPTRELAMQISSVGMNLKQKLIGQGRLSQKFEKKSHSSNIRLFQMQVITGGGKFCVDAITLRQAKNCRGNSWPIVVPYKLRSTSRLENKPLLCSRDG